MKCVSGRVGMAYKRRGRSERRSLTTHRKFVKRVAIRTYTCSLISVSEVLEKDSGRQGNNSFWPLAVLWMQEELLIKEKYASE